MCGIAGVVRLDGGAVDASPLDAMLDTIRHRGPNGRGTWSAGPFGLGHVRLSVLDLSEHAQQPMRTADGMGVLVYNGEVYNFPTLRSELEREGARFESHGDSAVVLEALHRWGPEAAIPRFDGMFVLAYVDRRDDTLWLARDRFGIKNLSLAERDRLLVFGSEAKAVLAHPRVPTRIDRGELAHYAAYGAGSGRATLFEDVRPLERGTILRFRGGERRERRYFDAIEAFDPERVSRSARLGPKSAVEALRRLLTDSVRSHLASDAPLATMCSGGVDSSLLTAWVKDERPDLEAFVADVGGEASEWPQAERVGRHLGVPVHRVAIDRPGYLMGWAEATWYRDQPLRHPSDPAMLAVTRACRDRGFRVLLTGEGADEAFGGYRWYRGGYRRWRRLRRRSRFPLLFPGSARTWRRHAHNPLRLAPVPGDPDLPLRMAAGLAPARELASARILERVAGIEPPEDRVFLAMQLDNLLWHLAWILVRHDRMGMAASIESRVPFLANAMVDFGLHLPVALKYRDGRLKWVLKQLARERLPDDVVDARKKGFPVPPHLYGATADLLDGGMVPELLRWTRDETAHVVRVVRSRLAPAFHLVALEIWARIFLGGAPPEAVGEQLLALDAPPAARVA